MNDSNNSQMIKYEDLLTRLDNKISDYLSFKDDIISDDYLEVLSDSLSIIKPIISGYKLISKKRLAFFLRGLNKEKVCRTPLSRHDIKKVSYLLSIKSHLPKGCFEA